ncbi:MAG: pilus assembly protein PilP [Pseudomonadales bacterium]|nr:pilus assembly protein PilP [Pseudomonadales bacterium]
MQVLRLPLRILGLLGLTLLLAACNRVDNFQDLQSFVVEVKSRPGAEVEPVPEFVPYEGFIYSAASMRSPFEVPLIVDGESVALMSQDVEPDFDRPREALENHALSSLNMVGMLVRGGNFQALIEDSFGEVHRVAVGNYMGRNHGRIEEITETQVSLIEIVPSGSGGWVERPQTLTLQ